MVELWHKEGASAFKMYCFPWLLSPRNTGTTIIIVENPADGGGKGGKEVE